MRESAKTSRKIEFSRRTNWDTAESEWSQALTTRRQGGLPVYDLTLANPTQCGFEYEASLLATLGQPEAMHYEPLSRGSLIAREAVRAYYREHAAEINQPAPAFDTDQIFLTTSTSEAYSFLFRLLCNPGDEVLVAQPSYPLFDFLATLDDVTAVSYPLFYDHGWHLDPHGLRAQIVPKTRAIVVVHPNNPTGHFTREKDRQTLESICEEFGLALIVDEVFLDYPVGEPARSFVAEAHPVLTFVLSGLSKVAALPQMKLSWLVALGPADELQGAIDRLDVIADTFLSLSAPMQLALPGWLSGRGSMQQQIRQRVQQNLTSLDGFLIQQTGVERLEVEGGWYTILRAPAVRTGDEAALTLMKQHGVAVHPGSFFGMNGEGYFVVSLLPDHNVFSAGVQRLIQFLGR